MGLAELLMAKKCPCCGSRYRNWPGKGRHHLVPKGQGGDDVIENIVVICGSGTTGCHGILTEHAPTWRYTASVLRAHLESERPECIAYMLNKKSQDWVDKHYPKSALFP